MRRFCEILIVSLVLSFPGGREAAAQQPDTIWIGRHLYNTDEYSDHIVGQVSRTIPFMPDELNVQGALRTRLEALQLESDSGIGLRPVEMETQFRSHVTSLMVMAGTGTGEPKDMVSLVYLGPPNGAFRADYAKLKLLSIDTQPAAERYFKLLLLYALIKTSAGLDFQQVIGPLRARALDFVPEAQAAQPGIVDMMRYARKLVTLDQAAA